MAAFFGATYCAAGYLHYQHIAVDESRAAQRAERANIDLQDALDRLRDALATARPHTKPPGNEPSEQIAKAEQYKVDRVAQLTRILKQVPVDLNLTDPQPTTFAARLSWRPSNFDSGYGQQSGGSIRIDQNQRRLQQVVVERDEAIAERDQLQARVGDLEQRLSLLQSGQAPSATANTAPDKTAGTRSPTGATPVVSARGDGSAASSVEQPRQGLKNFAAPVWAPDHFSDESGPLLANPVARPPRRASARKDGSS
jgi:hypothetical protein